MPASGLMATGAADDYWSRLADAEQQARSWLWTGAKTIADPFGLGDRAASAAVSARDSAYQYGRDTYRDVMDRVDDGLELVGEYGDDALKLGAVGTIGLIGLGAFLVYRMTK